MAAFMASAYAKFSGELGVCIATSGPGARTWSPGCMTRGSITSRCSRSPASRRATRSAATTSRNSISSSLFKDVAGAFVQQASSPAQVRHLVDRAIRTAVGERRVTAIILPNDLQDMPTRSRRASTARCTPASAITEPKIVPYDADLRRAAEVLNAARKSRCWSAPARWTPPTR